MGDRSVGGLEAFAGLLRAATSYADRPRKAVVSPFVACHEKVVQEQQEYGKMDNSRIYIHYGSSQYQREHFVPPKNCWWKPKPEPGTGLWASRVGDPFGWKDWCERNQFSMAGLAQSFCFTLSDSANLLTLHSKEQLMDLPQLSPVDFYRRQSAAGLEILPDISCLIPENWCFLDYEKMLADGTDAIEIVNWPEFQETLATWDCNSIYVMNPDIIHEMTEKGF